MWYLKAPATEGSQCIYIFIFIKRATATVPRHAGISLTVNEDPRHRFLQLCECAWIGPLVQPALVHRTDFHCLLSILQQVSGEVKSASLVQSTALHPQGSFHILPVWASQCARDLSLSLPLRFRKPQSLQLQGHRA